MTFIDTDRVSVTLRDKAIDLENKLVLVTNFANSEQQKDFSEPANCNGYGRIRHFKLDSIPDWPINPLPILPALKALKMEGAKTVKAQVFQNAVCNWRCWYCFVDFKLLSGNRKFSNFLSCEELLDLYSKQDNPPAVIDLTGGQPDLTPEWVPWMMQALINTGLSDKVYLWSDDNLSNDYFWRFLTKEQQQLISSYKLYGRVCCFKGIDELSFSHNTGANPELFKTQFNLWEKLLKTGIDLYSYITLPAGTKTDFKGAIRKFMDTIQAVDEFYPLRIVPLKVEKFTPVVSRIQELQEDLLKGQEIAIVAWNDELRSRFNTKDLKMDITEIKTKYRSYE